MIVFYLESNNRKKQKLFNLIYDIYNNIYSVFLKKKKTKNFDFRIFFLKLKQSGFLQVSL